MNKSNYMAALVSGLLLTTTALARDYYENEIEVNVVSDDRGVLRQYPVDRRRYGERSYVEARDDERYSLRVRNDTNQRVGVVIAVDGRNIVSGKKSHLRSGERMYVLKPWQTAEYEGWRTAKNRVNRFYFTGMDDSYAADWDDYSAMGVIAVAVFAERKPKNVVADTLAGRSSAASKHSSEMGDTPGTGIGEDTWSPSRKVSFRPRKRPMMEKFIKYEWRSTLCRQGIMSCRQYPDYRDRNRFWPRDDWDTRDEWGSRDGYAPRPR